MSLWVSIGKIATKIGWKGGFMATTGLFAGSLLSGGSIVPGGGDGSNLLMIGGIVVVGVGLIYYMTRGRR